MVKPFLLATNPKALRRAWFAKTVAAGLAITLSGVSVAQDMERIGKVQLVGPTLVSAVISRAIVDADQDGGGSMVGAPWGIMNH